MTQIDSLKFNGSKPSGDLERITPLGDSLQTHQCPKEGAFMGCVFHFPRQNHVDPSGFLLVPSADGPIRTLQVFPFRARPATRPGA